MSVEPGRKLIHYRLVEKIGEGGMGVVWKAVDTTLDREVAIKILPDAFASDAERHERFGRFEREAKLLASLSHPNIAAVYGFHEADGVRFLAMELVPGEDLSQRLARGPLPLDEALETAAAIAAGLETAHAHGIVHRDLKPANVKLTPDGKVKVLDFGLAKAWAPDPAVSSGSGQHDPSLSPTLTSAGTVAGVILGTAAYMSPEQARGKPVDRRTDVWGLGCILYEMLTARTAFGGETVSDMMAGVLRAEPDWSLLPAGCPASIRRLLARCLRKSPDRRLHDAADVRIVIEDALAGETAEVGAAPGPFGARSGGWLWALGGVVLGAAVAFLVPWWLSEPVAPPSRTVRLTLATPADAAFRVGTATFAFSPDGSYLVYPGWPEEGHSTLFARRFDESGARPLQGTEDANAPFFSPDGRWIAFFASSAMKKIPVDGGTPLVLADTAEFSAGAAWLDDGSIVYAPVYTGGLYRLAAGGGGGGGGGSSGGDNGGGGAGAGDNGGGGAGEALTTVDRDAGEFGHWWPAAIPGADYVLYSRWKTTVKDCSIWKRSLETDADEKVLDRACYPLYVPTGHLLFARDDSVMALPFDAGAGTVSGSPTVVIDDAYIDPGNGRVAMAVSADGTLAYVADQRMGARGTLAWIDLDGHVTPLTSEPRDVRTVRISPDGRLLALGIRERTAEDVWIHDIERGATRRFTFDGTDRDPAWTPDGKTLVFSSLRRGPYDLFSKPIDDSRGEEPLLESDFDQTAGTWSPDGRLVLSREEANRDLWLFEPGAGEPTRLTETPFAETEPRFSPDGRWIAYQSDASGRIEVYVMAAPPRGGRWQVSVEGGSDPRWSPDGRALYYLRHGAVYAVTLAAGDEFRPGRPRKLFDESQLGGVLRSYDLDPDGKRFVAVLGERRQDVPIEIVLGWFDDLRRRVP